MRTNGLNMTDSEATLLQVMDCYGYTGRNDGKARVILTSKRLAFLPARELPYIFPSVRAAAEYLIPIICDENYRIAVSN